MQPRVAVVIPCYEDGELAERAVLSVREQEPVELVVVDDGSQSAATHAALDRLEARGVRVLRQANAGPGAARSAGVHASSAPYVFPLDADDELLPGVLGPLADALDAAPQAGLAFGDYEHAGDASGRWHVPEWDPWRLLYGNFWTHSVLLRREAVLEAGAYSLAEGYEDWDLALALAERGWGGVRLDLVVFRYHVHGDRQYATDQRRHRALYRQLRARHAALFARRRRLAAASRAPRWQRVAYPLFLGRRLLLPLWLDRLLLTLRR